jgi:hypothetical protein
MTTRRKARPFFARVFNGEQIESLEPYVFPEVEATFDPIPKAEEIVAGAGVPIVHGGSSAFYHLPDDKIKMPPREAFKDAAGYYSTLLHEIGHATDHESRLARPFGFESSTLTIVLQQNNCPENNEEQVLCCNTLCGFDFCSWHGSYCKDESIVPIASSNPCFEFIGNCLYGLQPFKNLCRCCRFDLK